MELPDLSGQPAWVVIVVCGLFAAAGVAGIFIRRKRKLPETENEEERGAAVHVHTPPAISTSGGITDAPLLAVVQALKEAAEADRQEAAEARAEAARARRETERCRAQLATLQSEMSQMNGQLASVRERLTACEERNRINLERP